MPSLGALRAPDRRSTATACCRPRVTRARRRRAGVDLRLGALRRAARRDASACAPSAPRRRSRTCRRSSASAATSVVAAAQGADRARARPAPAEWWTASGCARSIRPSAATITGPARRGDPDSRSKEDPTMKATQQLHDLGQSLWLDNITRTMLTSGTLKRYIDELDHRPHLQSRRSSTTPSRRARRTTTASARRSRAGRARRCSSSSRSRTSPRRPTCSTRSTTRTGGVDGWVSLEVSPLLAYDTASTIKAANELHARAGRPNLFIKIPGTREGLPAIEESIFAGVPINVTLLFSREHYLARRRGLHEGSSGASRPGATPTSARWPRSSSAAGTRR